MSFYLNYCIIIIIGVYVDMYIYYQWNCDIYICILYICIYIFKRMFGSVVLKDDFENRLTFHAGFAAVVAGAYF